MRRIINSIIILLVVQTFMFAEEWNVKKSKDNLVKFTSSTTLLDFDGITDNIEGYIYWEGEEVFGDKNEIYFEVDINSVETGIGKRDRDMREDVLETDKWAKTSFKGNVKELKALDKENQKYELISVGIMSLHGHEKELEIKANIDIDDNVMNVICDFSVFLEDYDIEAPSLLAFVKVAEEIKLHLNFQLEKIVENEN